MRASTDTRSSDRQILSGRLHDAVRSHRTIAYFIIAFGVSWLCWIPAIVADGPITELFVFVGVWGPAVAAATVTHLSDESVTGWLRDIVRWRVPRRWYAFALGLPVAMIAAVSVPFVLLGHDLDAGLLGSRLATYAPMLVFVSLVGGGNEEFGWRGFALPELLHRHSPIGATLRLGSLWALWHVPLLAVSDDLSHGLSGPVLAFVLAATVLNIVALSFIYTFLWRHARSVVLAVLLHGSFNAANGTLVLRDEIEGSAYAAMQSCITITTVAVATGLVLATRGRLGPRGASAVDGHSADSPDPTPELEGAVR